MSHTPGPWESANGGDVFTRLGAENADGVEAAHNDGWQICDCRVGITFLPNGEQAHLSVDEMLANVALIAAAPDLLEAAEACLAALAGMADHNTAFSALETATKKARGHT